MELLETWSPVTSDFGLIDAPVEVVSARYLEWLEGLDQEFRVKSERDFARSLAFLAPLSAEMRRRVLAPTRAGWTAFFQSGFQGSDPSPVMSYLTRLMGVDSMRVCRTPADAAQPACVWEVYAPASRGGVPPLFHRRAIALVCESGRWTFHESGAPFPFENPAVHAARRTRDRFTPDLLCEYLSKLGLFPFDPDFYSPPGSPPKVLIERLDRWDSPPPEFSLEEVRAGAPWRKKAR
jgi:hypothetical protein